MRTTVNLPIILFNHAKRRANAQAKEVGKDKGNVSGYIQTLIADDWRKSRQGQPVKN